MVVLKKRINIPKSGLFLLAGIIIIGITGYLVFKKASANQLEFYPSSCLGNWDGVGVVMGAPEVPWGADLSRFDVLNSAVYKGGDRSIYCGNFLVKETGDKIFKSAKLRLSANYLVESNIVIPEEDGEDLPLSNTQTSTPTTTTTEAENPTDLPPDILPTPEGSLEKTEPATKPNEAEVLEQIITPNSPGQPEATDSETSGVFPQFNLLLIANAQESDPPTPSSTPSSTTEEKRNEISMPDMIMPISMPDPSAPTVYHTPASNEALQLSYSMDGENWRALPAVSLENLREDIPLPIETWEEVGKIQILIKGSLNASEQATIWLDGMAIVIEYEEEVRNYTTPQYEQPKKEPPVIVLDENPKHSCRIEPFTKEIHSGEKTLITALLFPSSPQISRTIELGTLPIGISGSLSPAPTSSSTPSSTIPLLINLYAGSEASPGSYNSILLYSENQENGGKSYTACQFNLVVLD